MLYCAKLTSHSDGRQTTFVGPKDDMERVAALNAEGFHAEVGPATDREILGRLAELDGAIARAETRLENAPWGSGARYRREIEQHTAQRMALLRDMPAHLTAAVA